MYRLDMQESWMYSLYVNSTQWNLRISPEELSDWKQVALAHGKLLSEMIREAVNGWVSDHRVPDVPRAVSVRAVSGRKPDAVGSVAGDRCTCGHPFERHHHGRSCQSGICQCVRFAQGTV